MKSPLVSLAAHVLREDARANPVDPDARATAISAIRDAMRAERRRHRTRLAGGLSLALAAVAAASIIVRRSPPVAAPVLVATVAVPTPPAAEAVSIERLAPPPALAASEEEPVSPAPPRPTRTPPAPVRPGTGVAAGEGATASPERLASELARQNDLFERAVSRKQSGDARGAIDALDELLRRYPSTRLAQSARADRMKLLRGIDPRAARQAAEEYLERYPSGFARQDAERILASP